ncbi:MAG: MarR family transcriptional regulator [Bacteroidia bacterium]
MNKLYLENQLCFKVYAISRQITNAYRPVLENLDITYPQYLVMLVLWKEKKITVKELGNRLYLDSGTLTPLLKRLEQKKVLSRTRDLADERSVIITLTTEGKFLQQKAKKIPETLSKCLSINEKEYLQLKDQLDELLTKLKTNN